MHSTEKVIAITGASSGLGYAAVQLFAQKGWMVYAAARRLEKIPTGKNISMLKLDVTDSQSNQDFIRQIVSQSGRIDTLLNNAGYPEFGPAEEVSMANVRREYETNFFGAVELTQLVLPQMRKQGRGRILNVSSLVGNSYLPLGAYYNSTKAALQQWSDVLDLEVRPFGVRSIIIQPGDTETGFNAVWREKVRKNLTENSIYRSLVEGIEKMGNRPGTVSASADELAQVFYKAATDKKVKLRYYNSWRDRAWVAFSRKHPGLYHFLLTKAVARFCK
ncbi:MAG: SDR family oxidoreductase [Streptococcaceae bacterium]|nr:SDR family oxidoreductase [Streptococcaceae bacterium]